MQQPQHVSAGPLLLTVNQVMQRLQLGRNKIYDLINKEGLPVERFGRAVRLDPEKLQALASYNCGETCVTDAIAQGGLQWQDYIPASTREYIKNILNENE
jgi:excisionase family DNA binding protein